MNMLFNYWFPFSFVRYSSHLAMTPFGESFMLIIYQLLWEYLIDSWVFILNKKFVFFKIISYILDNNLYIHKFIIYHVYLFYLTSNNCVHSFNYSLDSEIHSAILPFMILLSKRAFVKSKAKGNKKYKLDVVCIEKLDTYYSSAAEYCSPYFILNSII